MSYTAPALTAPVVLEGDYTAPALSVAVVLGAPPVEGALAAPLPGLDLPALTFSAAGQSPEIVEGALAAPLPGLDLPALAFSASGVITYWPPALTAPVVLEGGYTAPVLSVAVVLGAPDRNRAGTLVAALPDPVYPLALDGAGDYLHPVTLVAALPDPVYPLALDGAGDYLHPVTLVAALPDSVYPLALDGAGDQALWLPDADGSRLAASAAAMTATVAQQSVPHQSMRATCTPARLWVTPADPIRVGAAFRHAHGLRTPRRAALPHAHGPLARQGANLPAAAMIPTRRALAERAAPGLPIQRQTGLPTAEAIRTHTRRALTEQSGIPAGLALPLGQHQALVTATGLTLRWTTAELPTPGYWWPFYRVPPLTTPVVLSAPYAPRPLRCAVALGWTWITQPWCAGVGPAVPIQEVYVIVNTFSLLRADTAEALYALDFAASLEVDSWTWSWSAAIPATQEPVVRSPTPGECVEVIATINGTALRLVVERLRRERRFGAATLSISGRGRAAWLAAPYSLRQTVANAESRTAQQLLNDALTVNGVPIGWAVDWRLTDWTVPAGAWSQTGTYMEAAQRIAEAGGGYIQSHPTAPTLIVLPYYPTPPWQWAEQIPDLVLPEAVCVTEGIEWLDQPPYNAVWVVGGAAGRRDQITRAGTAGDCVAPTVVDPLATDTAMTRQRGLRVLADTGRQAHLNVSLPVFAEIGLITPGQLVQYTERGVTRRGLSRAIRVECDFPQFRQTLQIETHELQSL